MTDNKNLNLETIEVMVSKRIFQRDTFNIYVGDIIINKLPEEISIKTSGFELNGLGNKKINGFFGKSFQGKKTFTCYSEEIDINNNDTQLNILCQVPGLGFAKSCAILETLKENKLHISIFKNPNDWSMIPTIPTIGIKSRNKFFPEIKNILQKLDNNEILQKLKVLLSGKLNAKKINLLSNILNCEFNLIEDSEKLSLIKLDELEINETKKDLIPFYKRPYKFLVDILDCSFNQADKIAIETLKIDKNNEERLMYLSEYLLKKEIINSGSTYVSRETFKNILNQNNLVEDSEKFLEENKKIIVENENVFPKELYHQELSISEDIKYFSEIKDNFKLERIEKLIALFEHKNKINYDKSQKKAIINCVNEGVLIITGGAGCGKTTVLKCIMYILKNSGYDFTLCAPTGKASCRMSEATNKKSETLHSFYYKNSLGFIKRDFTDDNMCFIVDETSMCDVSITSKILNLIKKMGYQKLILIGDPFQLPSVGAGNVLKDIIDSGKVNVAHLNIIHRQGKGNSIIEFSLNVRNQERNEFNTKNNMLYCDKASNKEDYILKIIKYYNFIKNKEEYKNDLDLFYNDVQIIIPLKQGEVGVNNVNKIIKEKYNPGVFEIGKIKYDFKVNDKIMCIKNNKEKDVCNGDVGRVVEMDKNGFKIYFHTSGKIIFFESGDRNNFQLAYVCTVHKLQGSEYKFVIIAIDNNSPLIDSCLLYTAITRGKQTGIIISNKLLINSIINKKNLNNRRTKLKENLEEDFKNVK